MIKIVHIITGLGSGGAENMLYKLLKYWSNDRHHHEVISLMDEGVYGTKIEELGIKVHCLNLNEKNLLSSIRKTYTICKDAHIIDTWLYHADLLGFIIAKILGKKKLIWNIRHSNLDKNANRPRTLKVVRLNSILSRYVDGITYNSNKALHSHLKFGYVDKNSKVVPNGFELDKFKFDSESRKRLRSKLGLNYEEKTIITVGRWDIQKDYYTLLKSLNEVKKKDDTFKMLMVGSNLDNDNNELLSLIDKYDLKENVVLLGRRKNIPELLSAADIYVSSSLGESFSNAIGEAMACELPCVVTDVGDSKLIVGGTGKIVKARDHISLGEAIYSYIAKNKVTRNPSARTKILANYEIKKVTKIFEENINDIIKL